MIEDDTEVRAFYSGKNNGGWSGGSGRDEIGDYGELDSELTSRKKVNWWLLLVSENAIAW